MHLHTQMPVWAKMQLELDRQLIERNIHKIKPFKTFSFQAFLNCYKEIITGESGTEYLGSPNKTVREMRGGFTSLVNECLAYFLACNWHSRNLP